MTLDLFSLKLFVRVLEEGTISQAAEREHIVPAAVSRRIAELEERLQTQLLVRSNKGVEPTAAGLELLYHARSLLNSATTLEARIRSYTEQQDAQVHILANTSAITQFLPEPLGLFSQQHPRIRLQLSEQRSLAIVQQIEANNADLGIFTLLPFDAQIETFSFRQDKLVLLVPDNHPLAARRAISFEETLQYEHVSLFTGSQINYQITKAAMEANLTLRLRTVVSGYDAMCLLINARMGIGVLPRESVKVYNVPNTVVLELENEWTQRELVIGVRKLNELTPAARQLLDFLLQHHGSPISEPTQAPPLKPIA